MSKSGRFILLTVFNLIESSFNLNLTAAGEQINLAWTEDGVNRMSLYEIFLFPLRDLYVTLLCARSFHLCELWFDPPHPAHALYTYALICLDLSISGCIFSFFPAYSINYLNAGSLMKCFLCLKCMAPFRRHVRVKYSDWFAFVVPAKWQTLAIHLTRFCNNTLHAKQSLQ